MKKRKHLYPEMKYFVYDIDSHATGFRGVFQDSANQSILMFYAVFIISKLMILKMPLEYMDFMWVLMSIMVRFIGERCIGNIQEPQINYLGSKLVKLIDLGIVGLYGLIGVLLAYYNALYLAWIILFFIAMSIVCTIYWVRHCIVWEKFSQNSAQKPKGGCAFTAGSSIVNIGLIGFAARSAMNGDTLIFELALLILAVFCISIPLYGGTLMAMKLYYYYTYLRKDKE